MTHRCTAFDCWPTCQAEPWQSSEGLAAVYLGVALMKDCGRLGTLSLLVDRSGADVGVGPCGAELTVGECNCLPQYNYTVPETGLFLDIRNGSCIRPHRGSLPWCIVDPRTCIGKYRLLPDGQAWDSCAIPDINSAPLSLAPAISAPFTCGLVIATHSHLCVFRVNTVGAAAQWVEYRNTALDRTGLTFFASLSSAVGYARSFPLLSLN